MGDAGVTGRAQKFYCGIHGGYAATAVARLFLVKDTSKVDRSACYKMARF